MDEIGGFGVWNIRDVGGAIYHSMFAPFVENIGSYWRIRHLQIKSNDECLDHDGLFPLKKVFETQDKGIFVLCAVEGAGKSCAINKFGSIRQSLLVRCREPLSITWFNRTILGMTHKTERFSEHIRNAFGTFVTLVLSDFDQAMTSDQDGAIKFLKELHQDSVQSGSFNVLLECNRTSNAHAILDIFRGEAYWVPLEWSEKGAAEYAKCNCLPEAAALYLVRTGSVTRTRSRTRPCPARVVYDEMDERIYNEMRNRLSVFATNHSMA
jgi:hypothetical protein